MGVAVGVLFTGALSRLFGGQPEKALPPHAGDLAARQRALSAGREVTELFGEIVPGTQVGSCTVRSLHARVAGAIPVVLATSAGATFQVDVMRRGCEDDGVKCVASSASLAVYVCNGGDGAHATDEEQGLGAMALGAALAARVANGAPVPPLLTLRERAERFPTGVLRVRV